jgi:hypothetical protein
MMTIHRPHNRVIKWEQMLLKRNDPTLEGLRQRIQSGEEDREVSSCPLGCSHESATKFASARYSNVPEDPQANLQQRTGLAHEKGKRDHIVSSIVPNVAAKTSSRRPRHKRDGSLGSKIDKGMTRPSEAIN